jgi:hypothetical protein
LRWSHALGAQRNDSAGIGGIVRPLLAVSAVVVLLASGLAVEGDLAARDSALLPLVWLRRCCRP